MQVGGANEAVNQSAVGSAVVGTAIGALAGAALGGNHEGAAVGAGMGLLMGSSVGAGNSQSAGYGSQRGYDVCPRPPGAGVWPHAHQPGGTRAGLRRPHGATAAPAWLLAALLIWRRDISKAARACQSPSANSA
jgi:hypothetical protein